MLGDHSLPTPAWSARWTLLTGQSLVRLPVDREGIEPSPRGLQPRARPSSCQSLLPRRPVLPGVPPVLLRPHAWPRSKLGAGQGGIEPTAYGFGIRVVAMTSRPCVGCTAAQRRGNALVTGALCYAAVHPSLAGGIRTPAARSQSDRAAVEHYSQKLALRARCLCDGAVKRVAQR